MDESLRSANETGCPTHSQATPNGFALTTTPLRRRKTMNNESFYQMDAHCEKNEGVPGMDAGLCGNALFADL
jgi:hypothetical protein